MLKIYPIGVICSCPGAIYMYKHMKNLRQIRVQSSLMNLTVNDQGVNSFLRCSKFTPLELSAPAPHVYNHEKFYIKSEFKAVFLKLITNDQRSKCFICYLKLTPDYLPLSIIHKILMKSIYNLYKMIFFLKFTTDMIVLIKICPRGDYLPLPIAIYI